MNRLPKPLRLTVEKHDGPIEIFLSCLTPAQYRDLRPEDDPGGYKFHESTGLYFHRSERAIE